MGTKRKEIQKERRRFDAKKLSRLEISQLTTQIENREAAGFKVLKECFHRNSLEKTVCFTGPGGVGKSSLLAKLAAHASRELNKRLCWLACDPWSPLTGGSLLGDRIRLSGDELPPDAYVRSLSTRSAQAFSLAIRDIEIFMESIFDEVWVETAGSGQTQVEIADISAVSVLVLQPEIGDEIQWMKSGLRELVDLYVINKSDLGGAESMARSLMELGVPKERVLITSTKTGVGISEIFSAIELVRGQKEWKRKLDKLRSSLSESLYREMHFKKLKDKFKKERSNWISNPYLALLKMSR